MDDFKALVKHCERIPDDGNPSDDLRAASGVFLKALPDTPALYTAAAQALSTLPPQGAAWMAILLGSAAEDGGSLAATPALVAVFRTWLSQIIGAPEAASTQPLLEALPRFTQGVVAHVARDAEMRGQLTTNQEFLDSLKTGQKHSYAALWVLELLNRCSGPLVVLHGPTGRGWRLNFTNVSSCFHLFTLFQTAVGEALPGGRTPDSELAAAARGGASTETTDAAWWHYQTGGAEPNLGASVWGEALVASLPQHEGTYFFVIWPAIMGRRGWGSGFFGPALDAAQPDVVLECELSTTESEAWREHAGLAC